MSLLSRWRCHVLQVEDDSRIRNAEVYLYTRPVFGRNDKVVEMRHWALVFEFEDKSIRVVEGNEFFGKMIPFYYKESPSQKGKYYRLGKIKISPKIVWEIAGENKLNCTSYLLGVNNCQDWAKQYALQLGDDKIYWNIKNFSTIKEARPLFALLVTTPANVWNKSVIGMIFNQFTYYLQ